MRVEITNDGFWWSVIIGLIILCFWFGYYLWERNVEMNEEASLPTEDEVYQLEDGSYCCVQCGGDWYACDCPRLPKLQHLEEVSDD